VEVFGVGVTLQHPHHTLALVACAAQEESFGVGVEPRRGRNPSLAVAPAEASDALVGHRCRNDQQSRITASESVARCRHLCSWCSPSAHHIHTWS
jgi:hypothetical protein